MLFFATEIMLNCCKYSLCSYWGILWRPIWTDVCIFIIAVAASEVAVGFGAFNFILYKKHPFTCILTMLFLQLKRVRYGELQSSNCTIFTLSLLHYLLDSSLLEVLKILL